MVTVQRFRWIRILDTAVYYLMDGVDVWIHHGCYKSLLYLKCSSRWPLEVITQLSVQKYSIHINIISTMNSPMGFLSTLLSVLKMNETISSGSVQPLPRKTNETTKRISLNQRWHYRINRDILNINVDHMPKRCKNLSKSRFIDNNSLLKSLKVF